MIGMRRKNKLKSWHFTKRCAAVLSVALVGCGTGRALVLGPLPDPLGAARETSIRTSLTVPARVEFRWILSESGSRVDGLGVVRIEPPARARLDLFLDNGEGVLSAALVDDELRLPEGAPDDILPPVELMWGTLGVFRPMMSAELVGGDELEGEAHRYRYTSGDGNAIHYEVKHDLVRAVEMLDGGSVLQSVHLVTVEGDGYPVEATYRNRVEFRELKITRTSVIPADSFDPSIWDPRE
jgi:hypothetical protein